MQKRGRGRQPISTPSHQRYNALVHKDIVRAIKLIASYHELTQLEYLNNFFKDFIPFQAENTNPELAERIKEILKDVPYMGK